MEAATFELTLEQQFQLHLMQQSAEAMNREQMLETLSQLMQLVMVKDNVIKSLVKQVV